MKLEITQKDNYKWIKCSFYDRKIISLACCGCDYYNNDKSNSKFVECDYDKNININFKTIYVAGPYSANKLEQIEKNVQNAIDTSIELLKKGYIPYCPHLTHVLDLRAKEMNFNIGYETYMIWHDAFLKHCYNFLYLKSSPGADRELQRAKELGKNIYFSLDEVPNLKEGNIN